jgi:hypothetical protein
MSRRLAAPIAALVQLLIACGAILAHEHRQVGEYEMVVGWIDEPAYVGYKNGVQLRLVDAAGNPVLDLGDDLKVTVAFGDQKTEPAVLTPAFGAASGRPGEYRATLIPTRPGIYAFHFMGAIKDQKVNEVFTASPQTFDPVRDSSEIEFPAKDLTRADLALRLQRMAPRLDRLGELADQVKTLAAFGIVLGVAGVLLGLRAGGGHRRR